MRVHRRSAPLRAAREVAILRSVTAMVPLEPPLPISSESEPSAAVPSSDAPLPLPPPPAPDDPLKLMWGVWREATDRDTPTLHQLLAGTITRVDVDAVTGYVAVVTSEETHRAMGVRREWVARLVATLTGHDEAEVAGRLVKGPAKIDSKRARRS
jgi:hypothetical protein